MTRRSAPAQVLIVAGLLWTAHYTWSASRTEADWKPFDYFVGTWSGEESGEPGAGKGTRVYRKIMGGRFLFAMNTSRFDPQQANPVGETHEDWSFVSYDEGAGRFMLREFHSEGYVNRYRLGDDSVLDSTGERVFVFESRSIENLPLGWKARLTIRIETDDVFTEVFELAEPGKDFETLLTNRWSRD